MIHDVQGHNLCSGTFFFATLLDFSVTLPLMIYRNSFCVTKTGGYCSMWMSEEQLEIYIFLFLVLFSRPCSFRVRQKSLIIPPNHL